MIAVFFDYNLITKPTLLSNAKTNNPAQIPTANYPIDR